MTTCRDVVERLADKLSGSLPPEVHAATERHLESCECCRDYLDSYRLVAHLGRQIPVPPLSPRLVRRLRAILEETAGE